MNNGIYVGTVNKQSVDIVLKLKPNFVWIHDLNEEISNKLKKNSIKAFYPFGVFALGQNEGEEFIALNKAGNPCGYRGACPSNDILRSTRLNEVRTALETNFYDGIWLDAIRYPTYWETRNPKYLDVCYCKVCQNKFKDFNNTWKEFRVSQIVSFVNDVKAITKDKILGYFAVPETEGNLFKVFAQPPEEMKKLVDYVSPMIYPQMMGKDLNWVKNTIKYFQGVFGRDKVISIVQTVKMPENSNDTFTQIDAEKLIKLVAKGGNIGYFMLDQIANNDKMLSLIKKYLKEDEK